MKSNYRIKSVPGFEGSYLIDTDGVAWTLKDAANRDTAIEFGGRMWRPMVPRPQRNGYCRVSFCKAGVIQDYLLHTVVLTAFVGPRPAGYQAAHGNGIRNDNRLENLRWATVVDNHSDKRIHGTHIEGARQWYAKLNDEMVMSIRRDYASGKTLEELAGEFGVASGQIFKIVTGQQWKHLPLIPKNGRSKGPGASSRYKGVTWNKARKRWKAVVRLADREVSTMHESEEEAARSYDELARRFRGPDARVNFPLIGQLSGAESAPQ